MREKKWIDCPSCGAKNSMQYRRNISREFKIAGGYSPLTISHLDGYVCSECEDGVLSHKSQRTVARLVAEHRAKEDSSRIVAAEIADIPEAVKVLSVARQSVYKMMNEGRLRYVFVGGQRLPVREGLATAKERLKGSPTRPGRNKPDSPSRKRAKGNATA